MLPLIKASIILTPTLAQPGNLETASPIKITNNTSILLGDSRWI